MREDATQSSQPPGQKRRRQSVPAKREAEVTEETTLILGSELPRAAASAPTLMVISGPSIGTRIELGPSAVDIGRHPTCGLVLASSSVSRRHARVEPVGGGYEVSDLESKNGTLVNGKRVTRHGLSDGDLIKVGKAVIKFTALGNADATYYRKLAEISATDSLTGAANRRYFDDTLRLEAVRAVASGQPLSLILFDLDHFKRVNDELGHLAGDHVLREAARVVREHVPPNDLVARVGGEEFAVLCRGSDTATAARLGESIRRAIQDASISYQGARVPVTASLGVATQPPSAALDSMALYAKADEALYASKRNGRNQVTVASS